MVRVQPPEPPQRFCLLGLFPEILAWTCNSKSHSPFITRGHLPAPPFRTWRLMPARPNRSSPPAIRVFFNFFGCPGMWDLVSQPGAQVSLCWEHWVLAAGPPGKSLIVLKFIKRSLCCIKFCEIFSVYLCHITVWNTRICFQVLFPSLLFLSIPNIT